MLEMSLLSISRSFFVRTICVSLLFLYCHYILSINISGASRELKAGALPTVNRVHHSKFAACTGRRHNFAEYSKIGKRQHTIY